MANQPVFMEIMEVALEAMGITSGGVLEELAAGSQMMTVNCYPACPQPEVTLGMPPHSDYGFLTLVLQDDVKGLQVMHAGDWLTVEPVPGSFVVNVGDHFEDELEEVSPAEDGVADLVEGLKLVPTSKLEYSSCI